MLVNNSNYDYNRNHFIELFLFLSLFFIFIVICNLITKLLINCFIYLNNIYNYDM